MVCKNSHIQSRQENRIKNRLPYSEIEEQGQWW